MAREPFQSQRVHGHLVMEDGLNYTVLDGVFLRLIEGCNF